MNKHIPGNWEKKAHHHDELFDVIRFCDNAAQTPICIAEDVFEHNANLIVAAPALLHACENIVWKLSHNTEHQDGTITPGTIDRNDATVRLCEAAIAKAAE